MNLNSASKKGRHSSLKHLTTMFDAGFVMKTKNPDDGRRPLYALVPEITVCPAERGVTMDFGCCMLRIVKAA